MNASIRSLNARWFRAANSEAPETGGGDARPNEPGSAPKIGLALSAGGARGLAHVGVIQVLEEAGIPVHAISGTSMGAYVGALFAAGFDGRRLEELAREIKDRKTLLRLLDPIFPPSEGLIRGEKVRAHLERSLGGIEFAALKIPLLVVATDVDRLVPRVFDSGPVAPAVHASSAIPGVCAPILLGGTRYVDGGASDPLPVTLLRERHAPDVVIAVNVLPRAEDITRCRDAVFHHREEGRRPVARHVRRWLRAFNLLAEGNVLDTFRRSLMSAQLRLAGMEARRASIEVHPFFCESTWYDFENSDLYIAAGRDAARQALPRIRALITRAPSKGENDETPALHAEMGLLTV